MQRFTFNFKKMNLLSSKKIFFLGIFLIIFASIFFWNYNLRSQTTSKEFYPDSDEISQVLSQLKYSYQKDWMDGTPLCLH